LLVSCARYWYNKTSLAARAGSSWSEGEQIGGAPFP
jgi:hypothetical protein